MPPRRCGRWRGVAALDGAAKCLHIKCLKIVSGAGSVKTINAKENLARGKAAERLFMGWFATNFIAMMRPEEDWQRMPGWEWCEKGGNE